MTSVRCCFFWQFIPSYFSHNILSTKNTLMWCNFYKHYCFITVNVPHYAVGVYSDKNTPCLQNKSQDWASNPNGNELNKMCSVRGDYDGFLLQRPVFMKRQVHLYAVDWRARTDREDRQPFHPGAKIYHGAIDQELLVRNTDSHRHNTAPQWKVKLFCKNGLFSYEVIFF